MAQTHLYYTACCLQVDEQLDHENYWRVTVLMVSARRKARQYTHV